MMNAAQIREYIGTQSEKLGIDPALSLGLAELTGYSPNWTDGRRLGIMSLPKEQVEDVAAYQSNPAAQVDAGLLMLSKGLEETGSEFATLNQYTGSPKAAFKAYLRTARNRGQQVTQDELTQSLQALGLDLDPVAEAQKAGLMLAKAQPMQEPVPQLEQAQPPAQQLQPPQEAPQQAMQPAMQEPEDMTDAFITSTAKQKMARIDALFGGNDNDGDIPPDLLAYIKGLM